MSQQDLSSQTGLARPRHGWTRGLLLGGLILICGAVIGAAVTSHLLWNRFVRSAWSPDRLPMRMTEHLVEDLDLTDEQAEQVKEIVEGRRKAMRALRDEIHPRFEAELEQMRQEIEAVLTPEQAERWNERIERFGRRWLKHEHGPMFPHGPPGPPGGPGRGRGR
ncbi:Spy/CpxP family protein refolding chaperone [Candidatus Eisenbacteria bacterium]|uniref:Spy/CpxP family protein refolding chaperone n=1 Tax=Eiseniibacteriota bacterium TaxID=2212470 RepID=A0ABV6YK62_UNCEI